ncbi:MAG: rod-binding protein [Pseudomonadota bacterium]
MIFPVAHSPNASAEAETLTQEQADLRKAAQGFEAIMIRQWLQSARAANLSGETPLTGGGMKQFTQMRDEHFAEIASSSGTFGFARSIEAQLSQHLIKHKG